MDIKQILAGLDSPSRDFPRAAVQAAMEQREEIIPYLLDILADVEREPTRYLIGSTNVHLYAMYLLGQFREQRAYAPLVRLVSRPGAFADELIGDTVTEGLGRMLAGVWGGDIRGINSLIENDQIDEFVRSAGFDGHLTLVACGERTRDETIAYLRTLFPRLRRHPSFVLDSLVLAAMDLHPADLMDNIASLYLDGLVDTGCVSRQDVDEAYRKDPALVMEELQRRKRLITDTIEEMSWWACFTEREPEALELPRLDPVVQKPVRSEGPKVGRNDPCPCGSGKKYKKCCGA